MSNQTKETREYLKYRNKCIRCQKIDAYTLNGRSYCFECAEKMREINSKCRSLNKDKRNKAQRDKAEYRRKNNLCTRCGCELPEKYEFLRCKKCRFKKREENKKRYINSNSPRGSNGICWQCNKNQVMEGKKLCEKCNDEKIKCLEKAIEANRLKKENERKED